MDAKELNLELHQHEHPLVLVDLQMMHRDYEEDDDDYDDNDLIATQNFTCICNRCGRQIDWYHRYYYKCSMLCNYSLHTFCEKMPTTLQFQGHPSHILTLEKTKNDEQCHGCLRYHRDVISYQCSTCNYGIDLLCATYLEQNSIHHPIHPHKLIFVSVEPILSKCFACGKKYEGYFYQCTTCFNFLISYDCLSLPIKLSLQTEKFSHRHLLTLSYSFRDQLYVFECRICGMKLKDEHVVYKCSKCMYYVHADCAIQRIEPFMSILLRGLGKTEKNFKDADHPNLLHFPLEDESHILTHQIEGSTGQFISHEHPLIIINEDVNIDTTMGMKSMSLHEPMKRIKLLCTGCTRPITKMPFYKCSIDDDSCDFVLHDWCTRLPKVLTNHVGHPQHTLSLVNVPSSFGFICCVCRLPCNGFSYRCFEYTCDYVVDVNCGFIPEEITHEAHADHLLTRGDASSSRISEIECRACRESIINTGEIYYKCSSCDFYLDYRCTMLLPKTIKHKCDKHDLKLSYSPIEDHKSEYFCEICEEGLDPGKWFYHCVMCAQSIHSACAPLKLQSEQGVNSRYLEGVYKFINIKFGVVEKQNFHQHPLSFAPGTEKDGLCHFCERKLQSSMILKCLQCNFACHYHDCIYYKGFPEFAPVSIDSFVGNKRSTRYQPQRKSEFYPSVVIRPVTHHWKVVDDVQTIGEASTPVSDNFYVER